VLDVVLLKPDADDWAATLRLQRTKRPPVRAAES
jgi:hypothetical protein